MGVTVLFCVILFASQFQKPYQPTPQQQASSGSWDDGYNQGVTTGKEYASTGAGVPSAATLYERAARACRERVHPPDEEQWVKGFESGFADGYKEQTKAAF